jgi:hypothetical protein
MFYIFIEQFGFIIFNLFYLKPGVMFYIFIEQWDIV